MGFTSMIHVCFYKAFGIDLTVLVNNLSSSQALWSVSKQIGQRK